LQVRNWRRKVPRLDPKEATPWDSVAEADLIVGQPLKALDN
jgi:hypothetical protein